MPYKLRDGLSFCRVDRHLVFLDLRDDRYFRLPEGLEETFIAFHQGDESAAVDLGGLIRRDILTPAPTSNSDGPSPLAQRPSRSAMECKRDAHVPHDFPLIEVFGIVCSTRLQLKKRGLKGTIDHLAAYRRCHTTDIPWDSANLPEREFLEATGAFMRARAYVPVDTTCLLDALSMVRFFARRRLYANIVFGVTDRPFAAHCWAQAGDLVLNDTVGNATAHTPIKVA